MSPEQREQFKKKVLAFCGNDVKRANEVRVLLFIVWGMFFSEEFVPPFERTSEVKEQVSKEKDYRDFWKETMKPVLDALQDFVAHGKKTEVDQKKTDRNKICIWRCDDSNNEQKECNYAVPCPEVSDVEKMFETLQSVYSGLQPHHLEASLEMLNFMEVLVDNNVRMIPVGLETGNEGTESFKLFVPKYDDKVLLEAMENVAIKLHGFLKILVDFLPETVKSTFGNGETCFEGRGGFYFKIEI
mmetsp:Transcript_3254/g.4688  ORF Transcript_3254/g.4688 Transcript_3254/m.4688 type:complete len:243 (+) Transcript_3254:1006-1734(+)